MNRLILIAVIFILLFNTLLLSFFLYPLPKTLQSLQPSETIKIYDRNGELLHEVLNEKGRQSFIPLSEIPEHLKDAFLSIEDRRFYDHSGVDLSAILRAVWQNVSAGEIVSGGSTITQQVVRNIIGVNQKRTFPQKIKESVLALKISKFLDKDEVFEVYLNSIYFGGLAYGVEAASWQYFNKSAVNLGVAESAFLAGLPQAPNRYYPFDHFESAKERQVVVLNAMLGNQKIEQVDYEAAVDERIGLKRSSKTQKKAPHFVDFILSSGEVSEDIVTTLDIGLQERVSTLVQSDLTFLSKYNIENAAVIILDARNGDILAMVGSKDYEDESIDGQVNVATSLRQPGSSIKPLIYAAAIEKGWNADTIILDEPVRFDTAEGFPYSPKNFDLVYRGEVTLAEALAQSLNVPAVKTMDFVEPETFIRLAKSFGITSFTQSADHYGLSLALGSAEVQLLELASAYSVFVNQGKHIPYRFSKSNKLADPQAVIEPDTAQMISAILSSNELRMPAFGEENPLKFPFPVAAKTGTTRNFRDNWTVGYTDDYVVGIWVGNSGGEVMKGVSGISGAGPIFHKIMNMLHESTGTALTVGQDVDLPLLSAGSSREVENVFRIISPFANDLFLFDPTKPADYQKVKFEASEKAEWTVDDQYIGEGKQVLWPLEVGQHEIRAVYEEEERVVIIRVR